MSRNSYHDFTITFHCPGCQQDFDLSLRMTEAQYAQAVKDPVMLCTNCHGSAIEASAPNPCAGCQQPTAFCISHCNEVPF